MTLKLIAAAVVVLGCGYLGILLAARQKLRVSQIEAFIQFLRAVEFDVVYLRLPVTECLRRTVVGSSGVLRSILDETRLYLEQHKGAKLGEAWQAAMEKNRKGLYVGQDVQETLFAFAERFGSGDDEREKNNITYAVTKLQYLKNGFEEHLRSDMKLYRGLGFLGGILLVILLF